MLQDDFKWDSKAQKAFNDLKTGMTQAPVLSLPDFCQQFIIEKDASGFGMGAFLTQNRHPICYFSKSFAQNY